MQAGFARADITPPAGEHPEMMGFGPFLGRSAQEVLQPIHVRASYLEDDAGQAALLLSFDLCGLREELADTIRGAAGRAVGLEPERVIAACTHTHSAPSVMPIIGWGEFDEATAARLPALAAQASKTAKAAAGPVSITAGSCALEGFSHNRVYGAGGPLDTQLSVIAFNAPEDGRLRGLWVHYTCHPVWLCEQSRVISPDYCGVTMQALEACHSDAVCSFWQGTSGDINPVRAHLKQERSIVNRAPAADRVRRSVEEAAAACAPVAAGRLAVRSGRVALPVGLHHEADLRAFEAFVGPRSEGWRRLIAIAGPMLRAEAERLGRSPEPRREVPVAALALGERTLVFHPFEMFTQIGQDIRRRLGSATSWVVGYANGYEGYAPTPDRFAPMSGDYAAHAVPLMMGRHPYRATMAEELVEGLVGLGRSVR